MDLALTEIQQMVRTTARDFLARECPPALVRSMEEDERGYPPELWRQVASLGWTGLAIPEEYGGGGGSLVDLAVLLEEMGRALVPGPFFSTVVLGALTVVDAGSDSQKQELLPGVASGDRLMTLALTESSATFEPWGVQVEAQAEGEEFVIKGTKLFVPDAHVADVLIVATRTSVAGGDADGITLLLVPAGSPGLRIQALRTLGSDRQFEVSFDGVRVPASAVLGEVGRGWDTMERAIERAAAVKSVEMLGGAEAILEMTVEYTKQRVQFGRPIGTFQAIQHHASNMATDVECSRPLAYRAVSLLSEARNAPFEVSQAKAWVSDACRRVCAMAHQMHGAIGFTQDHNLQLFTRRVRSQEPAFGGAAFHREVVARALGL